MRELFARVLIVFAILGLPLQAVAAVTMPFCDPGEHRAAQTHGHGSGHGHAAHDTDGTQPRAPGIADDTVSCHHGTAFALPVVPAVVGSLATATHVPAVAPHLFLFFPEQPKRPPLA